MIQLLFPGLVVGALTSCNLPSPGIIAAVDEPPTIGLRQMPRPEEPPVFAGDRGSQVLARIMAPPQPPSLPRGYRRYPLPRAGLIALERPELLTASPRTTLISIPVPSLAPLRPYGLPDLAPLAGITFEPEVPQRPELPNKPLVRTPSRDVNLPIELPVQSKYQPDRASLIDPAEAYAVQAAQGPLPRLRDQPAPFVRVDLPDPFANRTAVSDPPAPPAVVAPVPMPPK